jgi:hypothetical protein
MREFKVRLAPAKSYDVETEDGQSLGTFTPDGPVWNGMQCLIRKDGKRLIVAANRSFLGGLGEILGSCAPLELVGVLSASPELIPTTCQAPAQPPLTEKEAKP